jgi:glycosyltransferase involved in cell wall biosynthesis
MGDPVVSVLMSVYNGEKYIATAIDSILGQTFSDFELIIIDDGSTDDTVNIINSYSDDRIVIVHNEANIGLTKSLNMGIKLARGRYVARMDGDDISYPQRLEKQVVFMDTHLDVGTCGAWVSSTDNHTEVKKYATESEEIKSVLFWKTEFAHPVVMLRKKLFIDNNLFYDESFGCSQDYDLWVRAAKYVDFANIPEVLLAKRHSHSQLSHVLRGLQHENACMIRERQLNEIGIYPKEEERKLHEFIITRSSKESVAYLLEISNWLLKIKQANQSYKVYPEPYFSDQLSGLWFECCTVCCDNWTWNIIKASPLYSSKLLTFRNILKLIYRKCILLAHLCSIFQYKSNVLTGK